MSTAATESTVVSEPNAATELTAATECEPICAINMMYGMTHKVSVYRS